jgi:hypothetical protein
LAEFEFQGLSLKKGGLATVSQVKLKPFTFATLPASPTVGIIAYISDSNTAVWGATIAGGGANKVLGFYNGTNWTVFAV